MQFELISPIPPVSEENDLTNTGVTENADRFFFSACWYGDVHREELDMIPVLLHHEMLCEFKEVLLNLRRVGKNWDRVVTTASLKPSLGIFYNSFPKHSC
jgi:hypothetical protein